MKASTLPGKRKASRIPAPKVSARTPTVCFRSLQFLIVHLRKAFSRTVYAVGRENDYASRDSTIYRAPFLIEISVQFPSISLEVA